MKTARAASASSAWSLDGKTVFAKDERMADASQSAIDAYAQQVLEKHAIERGQPLPDDSLGPYVASVLRDCSGDLSQFADYEGLIELLQEHCGFSSESEVKDALQDISISVLKNQIPVPEIQHALVGGLYSNVVVQAKTQKSFHFDSIVISHDDEEEFPSLSSVKTNSTGKKRQTNLISPNREDSLLPPHLLDEDGPENRNVLSSVREETTANELDNNEGEFPVLDTKKTGRGGVRKSQPASDLAAALFRPSRSRQSSIDESATFVPENTSLTVPDPFIEPEQYEITASMLLSMNVDLSHEAAYEAAVLAQADVGTAQYVVNAAMTAPPICRHLLQSGCYRSDCQFSHNIASHTCIFWIRGRCGKGETCRFLHGFHEKHRPEFVAPYDDGSYYPSDAQGYQSSTSSWTQPQESYGVSSPPGSFANIATRGYSSSSSFAAPLGSRNFTAATSPTTAVPTVRIPQDLWNPHENRDAAAFYIEDPLERYYHVMASTYHDESVIDLHFQSLKTYAAVLETVLPQRLELAEQVWIVTGTGHHVGSRTHQKGGGALESAVLQWLVDQGYRVFRGKDKNGQGGALLVKR